MKVRAVVWTIVGLRGLGEGANRGQRELELQVQRGDGGGWVSQCGKVCSSFLEGKEEVEEKNALGCQQRREFGGLFEDTSSSTKRLGKERLGRRCACAWGLRRGRGKSNGRRGRHDDAADRADNATQALSRSLWWLCG